MREGYYTDAYFNHTRETLLRDGRQPRVVMQVHHRVQTGDGYATYVAGAIIGAEIGVTSVPRRLGGADAGSAPFRTP